METGLKQAECHKRVPKETVDEKEMRAGPPRNDPSFSLPVQLKRRGISEKNAHRFGLIFPGS